MGAGWGERPCGLCFRCFAYRWPGIRPGGRPSSCFAKEEGKKGDPATPVIRCANDCPALLPSGGRRGTRPSGPDSRAGLPRLLVRCSAGRNGLFGYTEPLRKLSRALALDHLHFHSPGAPTGGDDGRKMGFACLSPKGEFAKTPPGIAGRRNPRRGATAGTFFAFFLSYNKEEGRPPGRDPANVTWKNGKPRRASSARRHQIEESGFIRPHSGGATPLAPEMPTTPPPL